MRGQQALFGAETPRQERDRIPPFHPIKIDPKNDQSGPYGQPDRKGKYAYEHFRERCDKEADRVQRLFYRAIESAEDAENLRKLLDAWHRLHEYERGDFYEAIRG